MSSAAVTQTEAACWACGGRATETADFLPVAVLTCTACGLAFQPGQNRDELRDRHDARYFETYGSTAYAADNAARRYEAAVRVGLVRRYRTSGSLLEIGSAAGYFLEAADAAGFQVEGIEPSTEIGHVAGGRLAGAVFGAAVEDANLEPQSLDVVCAWHVLEHLVDPLDTLGRVRSSIRDGGYLFVEVPNYASVRARREGRDWAPLDLAHHAAQYTPEALAALLVRAGFVDAELVTVPWAVYRPWPRALLSHLRQASLLRSWPAAPHPRKHELLRAVARARA